MELFQKKRDIWRKKLLYTSLFFIMWKVFIFFTVQFRCRIFNYKFVSVFWTCRVWIRANTDPYMSSVNELYSTSERKII